VKDNKKK